MKRLAALISAVLVPLLGQGQQVDLPSDFRQHNLTEYNANLFAPTASLESEAERTVALWTRWQWQTVDGDPTTIFLNYNQALGDHSAGGLGIFQHNTGFFTETGALFNYAHGVPAGKEGRVGVGLNLYGFQREPSDTRFQPNPDIDLPQFTVPDEFIMQFSPSVQYQYRDLTVGLVAENFVELNFSGETDRDEVERAILGLLSYQIPLPLNLGQGASYLRPAAYVKTFREYDTQFGLNALLSTPVGWGQMGYNNFYGASVGLGVTLMKRFSVGGVIEFGGNTNARGESTTFEFVTAFNFGATDVRRKIVGFPVENDNPVVLSLEDEPAIQGDEVPASDTSSTEEVALADTNADTDQMEAEREAFIAQARERETRREAKARKRDSIVAVEQAMALRQAEEQRKADSLEQANREYVRRMAQQYRDSVAQAQKLEAEALAAQTEEVTLKPGEKYEEVASEAGLAPGYYLIANVFGTKKYHDIFLRKMREKGLQPGTFFREKNQYNYVYLGGRFPTMEAAREGRDGNLDGQYTEALWIFRVRGTEQ